MRYLKRIGPATLATLALAGFLGVGTASATTLEVGGTTKNESINITLSIKAGGSNVLRDTFGFFANTCSGTHIGGRTSSSYTGSKVTGPVEEMVITNCDHTVTVHKTGKLYVEWTSGTNGKVYSEEAEYTAYSTIFGTHINCTTGGGTLIGTLTGVASGHATVDINATLTCGPHIHSAKWTGTYTVTSPTGLGVSP